MKNVEQNTASTATDVTSGQPEVPVTKKDWRVKQKAADPSSSIRGGRYPIPSYVENRSTFRERIHL